MAITKTSTIERITIRYTEDDPVLEVQTNHIYDDPDDSDMPVSQRSSRELQKSTQTTSYNEETGAPVHTSVNYDYSAEDPKIVALCDLLWSD